MCSKHLPKYWPQIYYNNIIPSLRKYELSTNHFTISISEMLKIESRTLAMNDWEHSSIWALFQWNRI
jgi:hypothetical protein